MPSQKDIIEEHRRRLKNIESNLSDAKEVDRSNENIPESTFQLQTDITINSDTVSSDKSVTFQGRQKIIDLITSGSGVLDTVKLGSGEKSERRTVTSLASEEESKSVSFSKSGDTLTVTISNTNLTTDELSEIGIFFDDGDILQYDTV